MSIADALGMAGMRSVGFVHAHPDDETLATGALIAALVAEGVGCHVLTATRGERGEVVPGSADAVEGSPELVAVREAELLAATDRLGVSSLTFLGSAPALADGIAERRYTDSGMAWIRPGLAGPAPEATADAFTAADRTELAADLTAWLEWLRPDLVVSYEADGGYGHPDHVLAHELTRAAAQRQGMPFGEVVPKTAPDHSADGPPPGDPPLGDPPLGDPPPGDGVVPFDLATTLPTVTAALHEHRTQVSVEGDEVVHVGGQREPILTALGLRIHRPGG